MYNSLTNKLNLQPTQKPRCECVLVISKLASLYPLSILAYNAGKQAGLQFSAAYKSVNVLGTRSTCILVINGSGSRLKGTQYDAHVRSVSTPMALPLVDDINQMPTPHSMQLFIQFVQARLYFTIMIIAKRSVFASLRNTWILYWLANIWGVEIHSGIYLAPAISRCQPNVSN